MTDQIEKRLPKVETYDTTTHVSIGEVVGMAAETQHPMPELKARAFLGLYGIEPVMERKIPNTRGRGLHLFERSQVQKALSHYLAFFKE